MKRLIYLIAFLPSLCFSAEQFFNGTALKALHANIADSLSAGSTSQIATNLTPGTYNYFGSNPVTMNAQNAVTANSATTATTATNSTQLNGQPASYYATSSALTAVQQSTYTQANIQITTAQVSGMSLYPPTTSLNITNWNTAYNQTLEWNGGSTNLSAATGRTSLNLVYDVNIPSENSFTTLQQSTVTAGIQVPSISQYNATAISTGMNYTYINSTAAALSAETANVITSTTGLQNQITTGFANVAVSTAAQAVTNANQAQTNSNVTSALGGLQVDLLLYGGQTTVNVNFSTGTSFVNVDTMSYAPGIGLKTTSTIVESWTVYSGGNGGLSTATQSFRPSNTAYLANICLQITELTAMGGNIYLNMLDKSSNIISTSSVVNLPYTNTTVGTTFYFLTNPLLTQEATYYIKINTNDGSTLNAGVDYSGGYTRGVWSFNGSFSLWFVINGNPVTSGSYSTVFSSSSLNILNNGGFYTWGKFACTDNQSTVTGSSITYTVAFGTSSSGPFTGTQTIQNNTLLTANTPYMQYNEYFNRWVSTATPITNSASFNVNYSPPLLSLSSTNTWTGANTFSSMTATAASFPNGINTGYTHWQLIMSSVTLVSCSSITWSVASATDIEYRLEVEASSTTSNNTLYIYINNDLNTLHYSYIMSYQYNNGTGVNSITQSTGAVVVQNTSNTYGDSSIIDMFVSSNNYFSYFCRNIRGVGANGITIIMINIDGTYNNGALSNGLTSITIASTGGLSAGIAVGSRFRLWALR